MPNGTLVPQEFPLALLPNPAYLNFELTAGGEAPAAMLPQAWDVPWGTARTGQWDSAAGAALPLPQHTASADLPAVGSPSHMSGCRTSPGYYCAKMSN